MPDDLTVERPMTVTLPTDNECYAIRRNDWVRLRRYIANMKLPVAHFQNAAWATVGIAATAALALLTSGGSPPTLTATQRYTYTAVLVGAAALAFVCFLAARQQSQTLKATQDNCLWEFDNIRTMPNAPPAEPPGQVPQGPS